MSKSGIYIVLSWYCSVTTVLGYSLMRVNMVAHRSGQWRLWALPIDTHGDLVATPFENS